MAVVEVIVVLLVPVILFEIWLLVLNPPSVTVTIMDVLEGLDVM